MKLIQRIKAQSNKPNRIKGQLFTSISAVCAGLLTVGIVANPVGQAVIALVGVVSGIFARNRALQVGDAVKVAEAIKDVKEAKKR